MKVLVTGANGHVGYNLVQALVAAGHTVRGSVRGLDDAVKMARLKAIPGLEIVEAHLEKRHSLRAAMEGMDALCHTAAIYRIVSTDAGDDIVRASVDGIDTAMRAAKEAGVGRIILTTSIVALPLTPHGAPPATEAQWQDNLSVPYFRAKTQGERHAWALARALGLDLVSILPAPAGGPGFVRNTPTIDVIEGIMQGALRIAAPPIHYPYVDVRDAAAAHVLALAPQASGRYVVANDEIPTLAEIAAVMHGIDPRVRTPLFEFNARLLPALPLIERIVSAVKGVRSTMSPELAATFSGKRFNVTSARIRAELGWAPRVSLRDSLTDTMALLRARV
ncbi:MAG: NAD(P)H-binding protein [Hyphomicrobiaceae bacterium]